MTECNFYIQGGPIKSKPLLKYGEIVLKPSNESQFLNQISVKKEHQTILSWY